MAKKYPMVMEQNQDDKFLQQIQMGKMKELWDNEADKIWECS